MFADAVHQVIAVVIVGFNRFRTAFDKSQVGSRQIGRTADNSGTAGTMLFKHSCEALRVATLVVPQSPVFEGI